MGDTLPMIEIQKSETFARWLDDLRDRVAAVRITARIAAMRQGHFGEVKPVGDGIYEMRIHIGPGYRVYYLQRGRQVVVLLSGGDKGSQQRDIERAKTIAQDWKE